MDESAKDRIRKAIGNYQKRVDEGGSFKKPTGRKNKQPEKEVVKEICAWLKANNFSYNIVEASTFDARTGKQTSWTVKSGFSDIMACDRHGLACYVEVKADGKLRTLKDHQREFLIDKINHNAFAGVFDSVDRLSEIYSEYKKIREERKSPSAYLLSMLPPKPKSRDSNRPLFHDHE